MNLATWWMQATAGVNYYRAEMPAKALPGRCLRLMTGDLQPGPDSTHLIPRQQGSAIWMFPGNTTRALIMAEMYQQGIPLFVEVDDNYLRQPAIPQMSAWLTTRDKTKQDRHSYEVHRRIVPWADGVICSTPYLGKLYEPLNENVHVCPNSVDPDDWQEAEHAPDGVLRIGWAGSWSHAYDLGDIEPALDWAARQPDVEVVTMGYQSPRLTNAASLASQRYAFRHIPWSDSLEDYRSNVGQIDVMLCPIRPNEWANCKSDVKALEAAMGNACSIVSRTEPYRPWWDGDAPGYVADSRKDYIKLVKHLIANRDEARETARLSREYALDKRQIKDSIHLWREALASSPNAGLAHLLKATA